MPTRRPHELRSPLVVSIFPLILLIDALDSVRRRLCLATVKDPVTLGVAGLCLLLLSLRRVRSLKIYHLHVGGRGTRLFFRFYEHSISIDLPDDLVHAYDALDVLLSLVVCSLGVILASALAPIVKFVEIVVGIWVSPPLVWHEEPWAELLLVIQNDDLEGQEGGEYDGKHEVRFLLDEVEWTPKNVEDQIRLRECHNNEEAHPGLVASAVPLVCSIDLWNPQATIAEHDDERVVQELVLVDEEKDKA